MRGVSSGQAIGTTGSPQTSLENSEYAAKVRKNEKKVESGGASHKKPSFKKVSIKAASKLRGYCLNPNHETGKHKARVFKSVLGFTQKDSEKLATQIRRKAPKYPAKLGKKDQYGSRYTIDMPIKGPNGNTATVRTAWIVRTSETIPDLVSAYVL